MGLDNPVNEDVPLRMICPTGQISAGTCEHWSSSPHSRSAHGTLAQLSPARTQVASLAPEQDRYEIHATEPTASDPSRMPGASSQTAKPKAARPKLPKPAPAASSAAASVPRRSPASPSFFLRSRSCFSISVVLAQKMPGKARNNPPVSGPKTCATIPAKTVTSPPSTNRKRYSYQRLCLRADQFARMTTT